MSLRDRFSKIMSAEFSYLAEYTRFPFVSIIPQRMTEQCLEKQLEAQGLQVLRPYRVVALTRSEHGEGLDVTFESGERINAKYVIGADGAKSTVSLI